MHTPDLLIFGGGISGLWTLRRALQAGYSALLVETSGLGGIQTLASQGVIHGGLKYALAGALTASSEALRDMPRRWRAALRGEGEIDLRATRLTSEHQVLWSSSSLAARATAFFASKTLTSRIEAIPRAEAPAPFDHPDFSGALYQLDEFALDVPSLMQNLANPVLEHIRRVDDSRIRFEPDGERLLVHLGDHTVRPGLITLLAGEGNESLMARTGLADWPAMQRRPLHQVLVRKPGLPDLFGVCLGSGPKPRLVVTTHRSGVRDPLWYLGGELAEAEGVARDEAAQISVARTELEDLFPWIDWLGAEWSTLRVTRAEAADPAGDRPSGTRVFTRANVLAGWPTKLALAPNLADEVLAELARRVPSPSGPVTLPGTPPAFALPPWS